MQYPASWPLIIIAAAMAPIPLPIDRAPAVSDAGGLTSVYNGRRIGSTGRRELELQLKSGATVTRRFGVTHLWRQDGAETRSLVFLESPVELRGTSYLWVEGATIPNGVQIFLRLPAGKRRVLTITPSGFDEGLLGSDFAYSDLLWHIPTSGRRVRDAGGARLDGMDVRVVESEAATDAAATRWKRIRYFLAPDGRALHGAEYYDALHQDARRPPSRRLRAYDWMDRGGGVWAPSRMVMSTADNHSSELILRAVRTNIPGVERGLFEPPRLAALADDFERGTPHPLFQRQHK